MLHFKTLLIAAAALATTVRALPQITRKGRYLYNPDGSRFYIKGVAYQPQGQAANDPNNPFLEPSTFIDPLADSAGCTRDIPNLQQLGVNVIRVYSVDNTLNHDSCMSTLDQAGIYTMIDLSLPVNGSIDRSAPSWTTNLLDLYVKTIDVFSNYQNVLGYHIGNEVVITADGTGAAAFVKAAARDVKAYLKSKSSSALVGYAAVDASSDWLDPFANYLTCDPNGNGSGDTSIDLFGLNNYEWCGDASPSVYATKNGDFAGYSVAAYFSEYGCITSPPRLWTEVAALFSSPMTQIWSGGIAFSYFPAESGQGEFGMVTIDGSTVTKSADFNRLKTQYGQVTPPNSPSRDSASDSSYPSCPSQNSTLLASSTLPPTPNDAACNCLETKLSCIFSPPPGTNSTAISVINGQLLGTACGLLSTNGGNCNDIISNGTTGTYGRVSFCDAREKLSYVMSLYYETQNRNPAACNFGGNAKLNSGALTMSAASAAESCIANPSATFVPGSSSTISKSVKPTGTGGNSGGSVSLMDSIQSLGLVMGISTVGALWTLLT
ncbi:glycoside hydrolase family 72 protein [Thelephora ganbajun]|uniref:Glycoside hydrolase family 72 protein n=1 Tax=Thelephora ganbajun TaxID=370292 RepID=A0ACB6ZMB9_THEGA|nr:glycoside hydrolase family 72 protein [Thelephora ganbajun]